MPTFKYAKLVRDNIWRWHEECGHTVIGQKLHGVSLQKRLSEKLHEEVDEVGAALSREELIEEIADIRQVLDDLCVEAGISEAEVVASRAKKLAKKGGFRNGCYIETVTIPSEDDEWAQYCRKSPEKYPEVIDE